MPRLLLAALVLATALLAGCGGGGDDRPATIEMGSSAAGEATSAAAESSADAETSDAEEPSAPDESAPATDETTAEEPTTAAGTAEDPSTVTVDLDPFTVQADDAERPPFPAENATGVIALAMQRPPGRVVYDVSFPQGAYQLTLANDGTNAVAHQSQDTGDVWIGASVADGTISWFCTSLSGGTPDCRKGDPDGTALVTAREIALVVGSEFIRSTFGPVADLPDVGYAQDEQIGRPVACMATTVEGQDLRLCATEEGYVTQITAGTTQALATEVSDEVPASELEPPAEPQ